MEEVKKKEQAEKAEKDTAINKLKKGGTDLSLKILALIIAVIVWFILSITQYPTVTKTIKDIRVEFNMDGTVAQEKGLDALNYKDISVDVEIKGMNYEIGNYDANDLAATVNLDSVTKEGSYKLEIQVRSVHTTDRCTVMSITPETVEVEFDRITQRTIEVSAEAPLITAEDGYTLKEKAVVPGEITVEGPKNDLDKISRVSARIAKSRKLSEDTSIEADDIVFYDEGGNKLDTSKFTIKGDDDFNINFTVYKKKTVNLNVAITDAPEGFDLSSLPMTLSQESISVITPHLDEEDTEDVTVGTIPLTSINLSRTFDFKVPLSSSEVNLSGVETVTASFDKTGYSSQSFAIDSDRIEILNAPESFDTTLETQRLTNVTVFAPDEILAKIGEEDIYAAVDLDDINSPGSYSRTATVYVKGQNKAWCYGTNEVSVTVKVHIEPQSSSETSNDSSNSAAENDSAADEALSSGDSR